MRKNNAMLLAVMSALAVASSPREQQELYDKLDLPNPDAKYRDCKICGKKCSKPKHYTCSPECWKAWGERANKK